MNNFNLSSDSERSNPAASCHFERALTFGEIAEMAARCEAKDRGAELFRAFTPPVTFVVQVHQFVASLPRYVE